MSSMSITWTSVCIPKSSKVSEGPSGLVFFEVGTSSSMSGVSSSTSSAVSASDDCESLAGRPIGHFKLRVVAKPEVVGKSSSVGGDEGISESVEAAVVAPL